MKRKGAAALSAGESRFRVSKTHLDRIEWLLTELEMQSVSALIRMLINIEYDRLQPKKGK
jgi:hypothetical protein